jgi:photosystem II stability/assembly factor-like uncharacterized protein
MMKQFVWCRLILGRWAGWYAGILISAASSCVVADDVWRLQEKLVSASLRGLSVVDENLVWISGSAGTVLKSDDGGQQWKNVSVPGAGDLDFRDVHAFDSQQAVVMSAGQPAKFYWTGDGGVAWKLAFEHSDTRTFFDSLAFWDSRNGVAMSDPVEGRIVLLETSDAGRSWRQIAADSSPVVLDGEAGFAASGTNMAVHGGRLFIALGGGREGENHPDSRILVREQNANRWTVAMTPIARNASSGIFSIAFDNRCRGVAVGGNYLKPELAGGNVALSDDGGMSWRRCSGQPPRGYRSCVASFSSQGRQGWIAVGPHGTDLSLDGDNWTAASDSGFHVVAFAADGITGWAAGSDGRIARWVGVDRGGQRPGR